MCFLGFVGLGKFSIESLQRDHLFDFNQSDFFHFMGLATVTFSHEKFDRYHLFDYNPSSFVLFCDLVKFK